MSAEVLPHPWRDDDVLRLTDELRRIASKIRDAVPARSASATPIRDEERADHLSLVEAMLSVRRRIANHFAPDLFADPARDLLLDLYASGLRGKTVAISSACIAAAVPATTALRWIRKLHQADLVEFEKDIDDNRRVLIRLTGNAVARMEGYLADVAHQLPARG